MARISLCVDMKFRYAVQVPFEDMTKDKCTI